MFGTQLLSLLHYPGSRIVSAVSVTAKKPKRRKVLRIGLGASEP
jgi:hypothetical protein